MSRYVLSIILCIILIPFPFSLIAVFYLVQRHKKIIAQEQQQQQEQKIIMENIQRTRQTIADHCRKFFLLKTVRLNEIVEYIENLSDVDKPIARDELLPYKDKIYYEIGKSICPQINKKQINNGFALLTFLHEECTTYQKSVSAIIDLADNHKCYLSSDNYGIVNSNVINAIYAIPALDCINHIGQVDIRFCLWKFAMQEPFDYASYMVTVNALSNLNMSYAKKSVDIILSGVYLAKKYGEEYAYSIYPKWKDDLNEYIEPPNHSNTSSDFSVHLATTNSPEPDIHSDTSYMLYELASALSYIGCEQFELQCLRQLYRQSNEYLKEILRNRYIDLQKKLG